MKVQTLIHKGIGNENTGETPLADAQLVLYFMSPDFGPKEAYFRSLEASYPAAKLIGCTTGGEIFGNRAYEGSVITAAIHLEKSTIRVAQTNVKFYAPSYDVGVELADQLDDPELKHVLILSDGLLVNGTDLVRGLTSHLGDHVTITGGLAGDGARFKQTGVGVNTLPFSGTVAAVGFYGDHICVSYGSLGGWQMDDTPHRITRSSGCVLYELDGKPALDVYEKFMGEAFKQLPGSGLLYPLNIRPTLDSEGDLVRTIIGVDHEKKSLIYAGDIPEGYIAQVMHGSSESLVDGASSAASYALSHFPPKPERTDSLGLLISCIGRNLLMGKTVSNEVATVHRILGDIPLAGFYSYGEICHHQKTGHCNLHNQTMTITLLTED